MIELSSRQAYDLISTLQDVIILDVRTFDEYAFSHIENAINIDYYSPDFNSRIISLDKSYFYLIYCRTGSTSEITAKHMMRNGFQGIYHISGGILDWTKEELPLNS